MRNQFAVRAAIAMALAPLAAHAAPSISSITTTYSGAGTPTAINIAGSAFCTTTAPANCATIPTVTLGGTVLAVTAAKAATVTATLPLLANGDYLLSLTAGTTGSVTYALTVEALDAGATGPTGATGPAGAVGAKGATGSTGTAGAAGARGATGATGPTGVAGTSGSATVSVGTTTTGAPGSAASVTNTGTSTAAKLNFVIPQGPTGATGATGPVGATGTTGATGPAGLNTDQNENTWAGTNSLASVQSNPTAVWNTAYGFGSLANSTASQNTAFGHLTMTNTTTGWGNTAIGNGVLQNNISGSLNTGMGAGALYYNSSGDSNTGLGFSTGYWYTSGNANTAVGRYALSNIYPSYNTGSNNTGIGYGALGGVQGAGSNNTAIGYNAGTAPTGGNYNVYVASQGLPNDSNLIRIGDSNQTSAFIGGITGVTPILPARPVVIDTNGQLGTIENSSAVTPFNATSSVIAQLDAISAYPQTESGSLAVCVSSVGPALESVAVRYFVMNGTSWQSGFYPSGNFEGPLPVAPGVCFGNGPTQNNIGDVVEAFLTDTTAGHAYRVTGIVTTYNAGTAAVKIERIL